MSAIAGGGVSPGAVVDVVVVVDDVVDLAEEVVVAAGAAAAAVAVVVVDVPVAMSPDAVVADAAVGAPAAVHPALAACVAVALAALREREQHHALLPCMYAWYCWHHRPHHEQRKWQRRSQCPYTHAQQRFGWSCRSKKCCHHLHHLHQRPKRHRRCRC